MDFQTKKLINDLTLDVINTFNIQIPITNITEVVNRMGGSVRTDASLDAYSDGYIRKVNDRFEIVVSPFQSESRKNFTIAHELGHLFLHMGYMIDKELWDSQNEQTYYRSGNSEREYQSNEFAAALLMPKYEYKRIMDQYSNGNFVDTTKIANYFNVSVNAASNRGKWLEYLQW